MIFVGQASLRHAIAQYLTHYHGERNHQGLDNRLLKPLGMVGKPHAPVKRRERLGGCSVTTIAPPPDPLRFSSWTIRGQIISRRPIVFLKGSYRPGLGSP